MTGIGANHAYPLYLEQAPINHLPLSFCCGLCTVAT